MLAIPTCQRSRNMLKWKGQSSQPNDQRKKLHTKAANIYTKNKISNEILKQEIHGSFTAASEIGKATSHSAAYMCFEMWARILARWFCCQPRTNQGPEFDPWYQRKEQKKKSWGLAQWFLCLLASSRTQVRSPAQKKDGKCIRLWGLVLPMALGSSRFSESRTLNK